MTTGASQADMTLIMVCESTRPRVPRETIVSSVPSVLLQGTATTRNSLTTIAAVSTGRTSLKRWERSGVSEMSTKLMVKLHNAFPARTAHPAVGELDTGAGRLDHGLDQQVADEDSVRSQCRREAVQETPI